MVPEMDINIALQLCLFSCGQQGQSVMKENTHFTIGSASLVVQVQSSKYFIVIVIKTTRQTRQHQTAKELKVLSTLTATAK